ncbi:lytic transglycosylase catalytic [mine drainage metagenome]|uniref:Lytic transglycosylase catalytic n=1 Tax=mine drainage metagenome TaxID=410659 RepID=T0Z0B2_9ZZZZ
MALALSDSASALAQAATWPDSAHAREALTLALTRRARDDDDAARAAWQALRGRFQLDAVQVDRIEAALALYQAVSLEPGSLRALAALPASAQTALTREWRVRVALARDDWPAVLAAIRAMPEAQRDANEWRYFEARALAATGARTQADARWRALARSPTYYGFLAADQVQRPYALCPRDPPARTAATAVVEADPGMQRAFEWYALNRLTRARREWDAALPGPRSCAALCRRGAGAPPWLGGSRDFPAQSRRLSA